MRLAWLGSLVVFVVWGQTGAAAAQDEPPPTQSAEQAPIVSLTFSPFHVIYPMFELTAEARVGDYCGIALIGGFGARTVATSNDEEVTFSLYELGAQVIAYPLDPFESLQLGVELMYMHVAIDDDLNGRRLESIASGLALGPLVGYKLLTEVGFTLFVQGGVAFIAVAGDIEDDQGEVATTERTAVFPLLNLNLGWSF